VVTPTAQGTNWTPVQTWAAAHQIGENVSEDFILFLPCANCDAVSSEPSSTSSDIATTVFLPFLYQPGAKNTRDEFGLDLFVRNC
jgi:hypothetical protein